MENDFDLVDRMILKHDFNMVCYLLDDALKRVPDSLSFKINDMKSIFYSLIIEIDDRVKWQHLADHIEVF